MSLSEEISSSKYKQRTIKKSISISGVGLFTGAKTTMHLHPDKEGSGIRFCRTDLPGKPILPAKVDFVRGTPRCTILGTDEVHIQTVEHVLAAIRASEIDNLLIEIDGKEVPSCDGSALPFVELLEEAGIKIQQKEKEYQHLDKPVYWSKGDVHLVALPSDEFRISYTLNYPHSSFLKSQFYTVLVSSENFKQEIAPARTFSLYEEIVPMIEKGRIKGGTLENAVIVKGDKILNPEGARFEDEMARHKILDLIGDLSLTGTPFLAHIIAIRSGHFSNTSLARELVNSFKTQRDGVPVGSK